MRGFRCTTPDNTQQMLPLTCRGRQRSECLVLRRNSRRRCNLWAPVVVWGVAWVQGHATLCCTVPSLLGYLPHMLVPLRLSPPQFRAGPTTSVGAAQYQSAGLRLSDSHARCLGPELKRRDRRNSLLGHLLSLKSNSTTHLAHPEGDTPLHAPMSCFGCTPIG